MESGSQYKRKISISFKLRRTDANKAGRCPIRGTIRWHGQEFHFPTGELVPATQRSKSGKVEELWDSKGWLSNKYELAVQVNARLHGWETKIATAFQQLWDAAPFVRVEQAALLRAIFPEQLPNGQALATNKTFRELLAEWKNLHRNLDPDSLRKYDQMATMMESWRPKLRPADVTEEVAKEYLFHLLELQKSDATIRTHFLGLKRCFERMGRPTDVAWLEYSAKNASQLDLEQPELLALLRWKPTSPALGIERDRWLFQLCCGRRYQDLENFDPRQRETLLLDDDTTATVLRHAQGKTGNDAVVPLPPLAVRLGERYGWQLPAARNSERNELIKEVARLAGLNREFDDRLISGGKAISHWRPVWQVISTHTARHTAATLIKQAGKQKELAKLLLGHADEDVTDRYAKDKARELGPALLAAWCKVLGEWYDKAPA